MAHRDDRNSEVSIGFNLGTRDHQSEVEVKFYEDNSDHYSEVKMNLIYIYVDAFAFEV